MLQIHTTSITTTSKYCVFVVLPCHILTAFKTLDFSMGFTRLVSLSKTGLHLDNEYPELEMMSLPVRIEKV